MFELIAIGVENIRDFMDLGGNVLYLIALLLIFMWYMIIDRIMYLRGGHRKQVEAALDEWQSRRECHSWGAHKIREQLISTVSMKLHTHLNMIQACVALCPLFGLLGTVTGMIEVFEVMAGGAGGSVRAMAGGVSRATIPTMAGMVAALSGLFFSFWLQRQYERERELLAEHLTLER